MIFDPDEHFVVVRSKRTGAHSHVDLRVLDRMLESIAQETPTAPDTGRIDSGEVEALRAQVERLTRDLQVVMSQVDAMRQILLQLVGKEVVADIRAA